MTLVADPQKKLTTTLLLRPKLRLKRGWPRPKQWLGTNVPYNNNGLDPCPCRVAAKEKKEKIYQKIKFLQKFIMILWPLKKPSDSESLILE